ncbi:NAD-dependent epimerase/dehydratase family protein [Desulfobacter postgatei]|uniref:NAD-dependent epimerase/dehydratase family protein n=1 Tax=Desulfobacter postgatei TaxID=2293 RepID=UPI00259BB6B0|nr:NAD-dependent epimerase/dehydratase family protein [uncultured Desulfobacter sp.]
MKKILITGGCGFIGVNLIDCLKKNNLADRIVVLDNESLGKHSYLEEFDNIEFYHGDIRDKDIVHDVLKGMDAVVHLAADTRVLDSIADPVKNFDVNVVGTLNVLNAVRENKVPLLVNASTGGAILGEVPSPVHEGMAPEPLSPYGASKLSVEGYCSAYTRSYGIRASSLRFSNVYGPRSFHKGSVVAAFFKNILAGESLNVYGDGSQVRDYVFVEDICTAIVNALKLEIVSFYQLGTGIPTTVNQLIDFMREVVEDDSKIHVKYHDFRAGEIHTTYCDISKAHKNLNYSPSMDLKQGLKITWNWFKSSYQKKYKQWIGSPET